MRARSLFQSFAMVLCVFALFLTQAFGMRAGFICQCAGNAVLTQTTHCHGPHGAMCHAPGNDSVDSSSHHDNDDAGTKESSSGNREEHAAVAVNAELPFVSAKDVVQTIQPVVLLLVATMPLFEALLAPPESMGAMAAFVLDENPLPFGVTVARTVVLLI